MLALMLDTEDILHIKQEMPSYKNLRVIQIIGISRLSSDRLKSASRLVAAAINKTRNGILGYLSAILTTDFAEYSAVLGG
ncbi:hypothetical protein NIES4075_63490 [Tolypothrix sp. NIES-4075]|nr:hypothetical protein NIES4075_63490 [Tolypothrix sp. NIES-4075]